MAHQTDNLPSCKAVIIDLLNTGKEPGALPLSSAGIPDPLPDSGTIGSGTEGRGSYCPHFGSKGGGAADRCCAGRI